MAASMGRPAVPPGSPSSELRKSCAMRYAQQLWLAPASRAAATLSRACQKQRGRKTSDGVEDWAARTEAESLLWASGFRGTSRVWQGEQPGVGFRACTGWMVDKMAYVTFDLLSVYIMLGGYRVLD